VSNPEKHETYCYLDEVVGLPCLLVFLDHLGESGIAMLFKEQAGGLNLSESKNNQG